ncbi:MAG: phospholipase D-like domain-containing protein [Sulfuricaulis sp.]
MISSWVVSNLALIAGFLFAALLLAHIIRQRRPPTATIAWILAIILIPYLGVPLFLLLGGRKIKNLAGSKARISLMGEDVSGSATFTPLERLLLAHGVPPATTGNRLILHTTGNANYSALVNLIEEATQSIYISIFILHPDAIGLDIIGRLARRAAEGVRVRLLLDGVGSLHTHRRSLAPLEQAGGRFAFFMPVLHRPFRGRTNLRNHRKTVIADERRVLAGGANIASEYMGPETRTGRWHDLTFTLEGPAVKYYVDLFRSDWAFASGESIAAMPLAEPHHISHDTEAVIQVVPSGPDVQGDPLYDTLLTAVFSAHTRICVVTPYFIPDDALCRALILAVHRGVDVRILLPQRSNHRLADAAGRSYLREIQAEGGHVLLYQDGMLHAKAVLCDDSLAILGSANIDLRSLLLNYEVAILIYSEAEIRAVSGWIDNLMQASIEGLRGVGTIGGIGEGLARLLAPQL